MDTSVKRISIVFLALSLIVIACQPQGDKAQTLRAKPQVTEKPGSYKIGFSGPLTGDNAYYGAASREGIELAVEEINKAGGIKGIPVEVVYEDDRNNTADAQTVLLKLARTLKVPIVIGINSSSVTLSTCKKAEELGVVQYSIGSNPKIGPECSSFTFQLQGNDLQQGETFCDIARYLKADSAAVVYINNDYGIGNKNSFVNGARRSGIRILAEVPLLPEAKDYRSEVLQVRKARPAMVAFIAYGAEGAVFLRQARELGLKSRIVGDANWGDEEVWKLAGNALAGVIGLQAGARSSPEYRKYAESFSDRYGKAPSIWSEYFYDEIRIAAKAIEIGGYTGEGIRDATKKVCEDFTGASGPKKLDEENYVRWSFDWVVWSESGKLMSLKK